QQMRSMDKANIRVGADTLQAEIELSRFLAEHENDQFDIRMGIEEDKKRLQEAVEAGKAYQKRIDEMRAKADREAERRQEKMQRDKERALQEWFSKWTSLERDLRVNLEINKEKAQKEIEHLRDKYDGDDIEFDIQVASLKARLELARVARARNVTLFVNVSKKSLAAAATTLAALSGARLMGDQLDRGRQRLDNID